MHPGAKANQDRAIERAASISKMRDKGLTYDEIGASLNLSADAVRQIVSRDNRRKAKQEPVRKYRVRRDDAS
jgi:orotate phosphoribosyltransferase-like protein